jgi:hypothetical protein
MTRLLSRVAAFAVVAAAAGSPLAATAAVIHFLPGTYDLDDYVSGAPPTAPTDTLVVTVTGGIASFALSGTDAASFSVPDDSSPTGTDIDNDGVFDPYYLIPGSAISASWDTSLYPYLTFWSADIGGGVTAGSIPGDLGVNQFDTSGSTSGPSQIFAVPEAGAWTMMVIGVTAVGAAVRRSSGGSATVSGRAISASPAISGPPSRRERASPPLMSSDAQALTRAWGKSGPITRGARIASSSASFSSATRCSPSPSPSWFSTSG